MELRVALAQSMDYRFSKLLGGMYGQILYDQIRTVAPQHCNLEQPSAGVPEDVGLRLHTTHLLERHELLVVGQAILG